MSFNTVGQSRKILDMSVSEFAVYKLLTNSPQSATEISKKTKIPYTSIIYNIKRLHERGLVQQVAFGKRKKYKKASEIRVNTLITAIEEIFIPNIWKTRDMHPSIVFYRGLEAMKKTYMKVKDLPDDTVFYAIQSVTAFREQINKTGPEYLDELAPELSRFVIKSIVSESQYKFMAQRMKEKGIKEAMRLIDQLAHYTKSDYVVLPEEDLTANTELFMFLGTAWISNWKDEICIEITNDEIVDLLHVLFRSLRSQGTRIRHLDYMNKIKEHLKE